METKSASAHNAGIQAVDSPLTTGGAGTGGYLSGSKDARESATDAKFGDVWNQIQAKYGAKPEKAREIKKTLGKDDFLRIMITQMKHQDPTTPFKAEQFATELAQFTSVEQLQNMNQSLGKLLTANQPLERMAMTGMIGKTITVDRERFPHTEGQNDSLAFALPKDAKEVKVTVVSDTGETVYEKEMGALKQGDNTFSWDGLKKNTLAAKSGTYLFKINAQDENGQSIQINTKGQARVVGISFEGNETVLLTGDINRPEKVTMRNVVRIDGDGQTLIPGARPLSGGIPPPTSGNLETASALPSNKMIAFQKGVGSSNLDASALPPDAARAIAQYQNQMAPTPAKSGSAMSAQAPQEHDNGEKGFPNGLHDND